MNKTKGELKEEVDKIYRHIKNKKFDITDSDILSISYNNKKYPTEIIDYLRTLKDDERDHFINELNELFDCAGGGLKIKESDLNSSISKLFYLMLWKQGDLDKFGGIIKGLNSQKCNDEKCLFEQYKHLKKSFVFYQLGRHIAHSEPIVDQHVIRAFAALIEFEIILINNKYKVFYRNIKNGLTTKKHKSLILDYINWVDSLEIEKKDLYKLDQVMFSLGKNLKTIKS